MCNSDPQPRNFRHARRSEICSAHLGILIGLGGVQLPEGVRGHKRLMKGGPLSRQLQDTLLGHVLHHLHRGCLTGACTHSCTAHIAMAFICCCPLRTAMPYSYRTQAQCHLQQFFSCQLWADQVQKCGPSQCCCKSGVHSPRGVRCASIPVTKFHLLDVGLGIAYRGWEVADCPAGPLTPPVHWTRCARRWAPGRRPPLLRASRSAAPPPAAAAPPPPLPGSA